jgi:hypothetical protein
MADEKKWIQCREGWISYQPAGDGYYVTASGHRAMTVSTFEFRGVIDELTQALGGRVIRRTAY